MKKPDYKLFDFQGLLSENNLCQSWRAVNRETDKPCLVKTPAANSELGPGAGKAILSESFRCQKSIRSGRVVRAIGKYLSHGSVFIEYPYLDHADWSVLTSDLFLRHFQAVAPQIASTVDFLHMLGLVHCDLKLDNFLVRSRGRSVEVMLMDLDFLCRENTDPEARVLGTPEHIAPEILDNDRIVIQSDMYSLGVSLRYCLKTAESRLTKEATGGIPADDRLAVLVEEMTRKDPLRRPRFLLESLHLHHLMERAAFEKAQKGLLAALLISRLRTNGSSGLESSKGVEKFLQRDNKILGPGNEMFDRLGAAFARDRRRTVQAFKGLLSEAAIDRNADYWHLETADRQLLQVYDTLADIAGDPAAGSGKKSSGGGVRTALSIAGELAKEGHSEHAYLSLRERWRGQGNKTDHRLADQALTELVSLARSLNRLGEADEYLEKLAALRNGRCGGTLESLYDRVIVNVMMGRFDVADRLIKSRPNGDSRESDHRSAIGLRRAEAWVLQNRGEFEPAEKILKEILKEARERQMWDLVVLILYNRGVLSWRQGDYRRSDLLLTESFELAERENILSDAIPVISTLALLSYEQADYARSIRFGKLASKMGTEPHHLPWLPSICAGIANAQVRLADFPKAEYWLQRYLSLAPRQSSKTYLLNYYVGDGFLNYNRGNLIAARDSLYKARELIDPKYGSKSAGKVYYNLAEVALSQGKFAECGDNLAKARAFFEEIGDEASLAELKLIGILQELYSGDSRDMDRLIGQAPVLIEKRCLYYAVLCVYHALLHARGNELENILQVVQPITEIISQSRTPLFRAVSALLDALLENEGNAAIPVKAWKDAFSVLFDGSQKYLAMQAAIKIAAQYADTANSKHAKKFLLQARRLAEALDNDHVAQTVRAGLDRVSKAADNSARLIESFHGISRILVDLGDYRRSLERLIEFAVDQTGAERGVIFLKTGDRADLTVAASLNCDDRSLSDIKDFSMNIPHATIKQLSPIVIENALADNRTNKYESIVLHNILSVICVPLSHGAHSLGALYLDHHTIPALFDKEDLTFIQSVANFISVALSAAQDIRSQVLTNLQMQQDLERLGAQQSFITGDPTCLNLLKKLPQIAATTTSVLLLGENGTGKEILGDMIHNYSPRRGKPFIKLNCAAIPQSMIETELFGILRRVATDVAEREGRFSAADGGTMYLDEIGDMPVEIQKKVLRVLEKREFQKVGSNHTITTDIRYVYATNRNLRQMVEDGEFRPDLYHRINTIVLEIPPLRERAGDVPMLIDHFLDLFGKTRTPPRFSASAMEALIQYHWPGNVRELKNVVERHFILHPGQIVTLEMLAPELREGRPGNGGLKAVREAEEAEQIRQALIRNNWNQSQTARELGMSLSTLRRKMKKFGIKKPK